MMNAGARRVRTRHHVDGERKAASAVDVGAHSYLLHIRRGGVASRLLLCYTAQMGRTVFFGNFEWDVDKARQNVRLHPLG